MALHDPIDRALEGLEDLNLDLEFNGTEGNDVKKPHGDSFTTQPGEKAYETVKDELEDGIISSILGWKPVEGETYKLDSGDHTVEVYAEKEDRLEIYGLGEELTEYFEEDAIPSTMLPNSYAWAEDDWLD